MPQAIAAIAIQAAEWVGSTVVALGGSIEAGEIAGSIAYAAVEVGVPIALSAASAALFAPDIPNPELQQSSTKQTVPPRISGYGAARLGGAYMLYESDGNYSYDVVALCDGGGANPPVTEFLKFYLNDDYVTLGGGGFGLHGAYVSAVPSNDDGRYNGQVAIDYRYGEATEVAYGLNKEVDAGYGLTVSSPVLTGIWSANNRGDGIASVYLRCQHGKEKFIPQYYPNGLPRPGAAAKLLAVYDWRKDSTNGGTGTHRLADPATWEWSDNNILCLAHYECFHPHGPLKDFTTRIQPQLASWTEAANVCDEAVSLKAGGTEKRYRLGGTFNYENARGDVRGKMLEACDGYTADAADGSLIVYAGKYYAPTVTLAQDDIKEFRWRRFVQDEEAVNELAVSFTDPDKDYVEVQATPWRDESDIDLRGEVRSQTFYPGWVQSKGQARRLAKRAMSRHTATVRGSVRCNLSGLQVISERYVRLQIPSIAVLADVVVEIVTPPQIDFATLSVSFDYVSADPNIDAWDPATEEGDVNQADRPVGTPLVQPVIDDIVVFTQPISDASTGTRLRITATGADRNDLNWVYRWRLASGLSEWTESASSDISGYPTAVFETDFVPANADLEVQVAYVTGGSSMSEWSATSNVTSSVPTGGELDFSRPAMSGLDLLMGYV